MSKTFKMVTIVGTSPNSYEDAMRNGVADASQSLRNMYWFEVQELRGRIEEGGVREAGRLQQQALGTDLPQDAGQGHAHGHVHDATDAPAGDLLHGDPADAFAGHERRAVDADLAEFVDDHGPPVIDGDLPRSRIRDDNVTFTSFAMSPQRNRESEYNARLNGPGVTPNPPYLYGQKRRR